MDYISDKLTYMKTCPKCKEKKLKVTEWEEHLEGWGFENYKTEYFRRAVCLNCGYGGNR